jgi:hypothetical protein
MKFAQEKIPTAELFDMPQVIKQKIHSTRRAIFIEAP